MLLAGVLDAAPLDQPAPDVLAEGRRIVHEMIVDPRGPYSRIRWFCNDGTTQPPVPYACRERGGGRQHAEYSTKRNRLAELGWSVGTIYASLTIDDLTHSAPRQQRLRQLPLEQYLVDIDNGWVLQSALGYRGRVQVENEQTSGRDLLLQLLADPAWVDANFLLLRESTRVIPHGEDTDLARSIRRAAIELAELEPAAERWRAEIHAKPNAGTAGRLRAWLRERPRPAVRELGMQLADDLDLLYGETGRLERITAALSGLRSPAAGSRWRDSVNEALAGAPAERIAGVCSALAAARTTVLADLPAAKRLSLLDAMQGLETEVQLTYQELSRSATLTRAALLGVSRALIDCAYGSGLLSASERGSLARHLLLEHDADVALIDYANAVAHLKRAPGWAVGTIRYTFAEALIRYTALDPRAARFSDDMIRSSPMWMLGDTLRILSKDIDTLSGSVVEMAGQTIPSAVALNSGIARGTLRIFETTEDVEAATIDRSDIVVLPETIAELSPVAGILTLGEGNALSHVQLLARNFGIPNVAVDQQTVDILRPLENVAVILIADNDGNVILRPYDENIAAVFEDATQKSAAAPGQIEVPVPDLRVDRVLPLPEIGRSLSGKVVGPKAANLGELNRLFPGRVAPAVAIPFGIYAKHVREAGLMLLIREAFAASAAGTISKVEFDETLADVRKRIAALELSPSVRNELAETMQTAFGDPGTYGVFVRSDTNVEDLPQFTGAGLNETLPNVVGLDRQLAAIPRVWSSVFSPRALAWRSSVLSNPDQIYASVLLMKSVPASKSGVLVTANLFDRNDAALTASVAWGVGGAVAGEPAASIVIHEDRTETYSEAKSPYQRRIAESGGVDWVQAPAGPVLSEDEVAALRQLAAEVNEKYAPVSDEYGNRRPWDIEFGFVDGELALFQIRPLVERATQNANLLLRRLQPDLVAKTERSQVVELGAPPRS